MFVTTTIAVIYWTVFLQGMTVKPLVKLLHVKTRLETFSKSTEYPGLGLYLCI
jgi:sodium/hydrogen exchanger-like protein 3